ncbi:hypothetical protein NC653_037850 [Populus alba x Populus x berolinensis]|uniref:Uncharacterized protein n=1 Tax=Populus alba x Populus x berolinensis TaxID=444605 RepID=A0AAD6LFF6_9ROSI|nr:hypothetical protein NC653_037850 [Populus alba x Populus x berolinensis]
MSTRSSKLALEEVGPTAPWLEAKVRGKGLIWFPILMREMTGVIPLYPNQHASLTWSNSQLVESEQVLKPVLGKTPNLTKAVDQASHERYQRMPGDEDPGRRFNSSNTRNVSALYRALLGRPWIHNNYVVPSTFQQCFKYKTYGDQKMVT